MDVGRRGEMLRRRRRRSPVWAAVAASLAFHLLLATLLVLSEGWMGRERPRPRMKVYAVNIVSPPPTVAGPTPTEEPAPSSGPSASTPTPAAPAPAPAPAPPPPPPSPAPKTEPRPTPRPEPAKAPEPTRTPPRTPPAERPKANEPRPKAAEPRPKADEPSRTPSTTTRNERGGTSAGSGGPRSAGTGTRGQATGRNPNPNSAGGEGLSIQQAGMECPSPGYCENIVRQVRRYFRRPEGSNGSAEVCFTIQRDGSTDDVEVNRVRGGFPFRLAVQEAVEQAGMRKAFGALPRAFGAETLPVCVDISPQI